MNRKVIKFMLSSLVVIGSISNLSQKAIADIFSPSINDFRSLTSYANNDNKSKSDDDKKDKHNGFNVFGKENLRYLTSDEKNQLLELKKCRDDGAKFSKEQEEKLHLLANSIFKGKLGDEKYKDFKCLMEKKRTNQTLTDEENNKLKEYRSIINSSKPTTKDILNQFLR